MNWLHETSKWCEQCTNTSRLIDYYSFRDSIALDFRKIIRLRTVKLSQCNYSMRGGTTYNCSSLQDITRWGTTVMTEQELGGIPEEHSNACVCTVYGQSASRSIHMLWPGHRHTESGATNQCYTIHTVSTVSTHSLKTLLWWLFLYGRSEETFCGECVIL